MPTPMFARRLHLAMAALFVLKLAACADSADMAGSAAQTAGADASNGNYNPTAGTSAGKTGSGGGYAGADASASADASGTFSGGPAGQPNTPAQGASDTGIGLKPGGAQDIAFFRQKVAAKQLPKSTDLTLEGFLNEHDTVLPPAQKDRVVSLHALAAVVQPQGGKAEAVIQLGLNSAKKLDDLKTTLALTVVIDRSGSMQGEKMADVKAGLHEMADHLPAGTRLGIVSFSSDVKTAFAAAVIGKDNLPQLHQAIDAIVADGGTNIYAGMEEGQKVCQAAGSGFAQKRILFLSDGQATVGNTSHAAIVGLTKATAAEGCSVSTVGVGFDFDLGLMTEMAQVGNGTAWYVQNSDHAKAVFVQDLETMLLPVAEKLWMQFTIGNGWKLLDIPGFEWAIKDGVVTITGTKKATEANPPPVEQPDPADPNAGKVAMPTLFASKKNGMILVRMQAPDAFGLSDFNGLLLSTVTYGYSIAKTGAKEQFTVPVQVPGLVSVPDGGYGYYASPIVRRAFAILRVGVDLIDACKLAEAGQGDAAKAVLDNGGAFLAGQVKDGGDELKAVDTSNPDLADAAKLLADLKALVK